jgi:hypothetical protein
MFRWFEDEDLGMCRVIRFGGHRHDGKMEPVMHYSYLDAEGKTHTEKSSLEEVEKWVRAEKSNL